MRTPPLLLAALLLAFPAVASSPQDDAGSGGDAPTSPGSLLLGAGTYDGALPDADPEDAYAVGVEDGFLTLVRVTGDVGVRVEYKQSDPVRLRMSEDGWFLITGKPLAFQVRPARFTGTAPYPYVMTVERIEPVRFNVTDVRLEYEDRYPGEAMIVATVENPSARDDLWATFDAYVTQGRSDRYMTRSPRMPAGASHAVGVWWDQKGHVGDVEIVACATSFYSFEAQCTEPMRTYVLLRGEGRDLFNEDVGVPLPDGTTLWVDPEYDNQPKNLLFRRS